VVRGEDGSATVAMWMEFSRFDGPENKASFGRFSDMTLSQFVSLRPDEALLHLEYRVANPAPWRQGWKVWNDAFLPRHHTPAGIVQGADRPPPQSESELVYPAAWVSTHNGTDLRRLAPEALRLANYTTDYNISLFAWDLAAGFAGVWYPSVRVNRLRVFDPAEAPGAKFFFVREGLWREGGRAAHMTNFVELWGGPHHVFEGVEDWIAPGQARRIRLRYAYVRGIGKADFANQHAVLHFEPGKVARQEGRRDSPQRAGAVLEVVTLRPTTGLAVAADGRPAASGLACGPNRPVRVPLGAAADRVAVRLTADGQVLADVRLPLEVPDSQAAHEAIWRALGRGEGAGNENHEKTGVPAGWGRTIFRAAYPAGSLGAARVDYYLGRTDKAIAALREHVVSDAGRDEGEAWHLLGAALLESGRQAEAAPALERALAAPRPYPQAAYFLALCDLAEGKERQASARLAKLVEACPDHWHGRVLLACLEGKRGSTERAAALAREDPADPRAAWVLWKAAAAAGETESAEAAQKTFETLASEPGAARRMEEFTAATQGRYMAPRRIRTDVPAPPKPKVKQTLQGGARRFPLPSASIAN
jgi:tetratricopeptide (TPR) repeat protein